MLAWCQNYEEESFDLGVSYHIKRLGNPRDDQLVHVSELEKVFSMVSGSDVLVYRLPNVLERNVAL